MAEYITHPASYRDPSGFVFIKDGNYYRQINKSYADHYQLLIDSGLYQELVTNKKLLAHEEVNDVVAEPENWYKTLLPLQLHHISYPYEWCFGQLKDAAMLTLSVMKSAVAKGMVIKDATPFNIQFVKGVPLFIDTLSFEKYDESAPWVAYRQFCNMFLFPLYLEYYLTSDIQKIISAYPDGIPVDITAKLLPLKSGLSLGVWLHVYLQNTITQNSSRKSQQNERFSKRKLLNLIDHLEGTIGKMNYRTGRSEWSDYYDSSILGKSYLDEKEKVFRTLIGKISFKTALDLGANDGYFSKILAAEGADVVAIDSDSRSVGKLYEEIKINNKTNILPLVVDVANPTPAIGFRNRERASFHERMTADLVTALALVHHLAITKNVSLPAMAEYFNDIARLLIIEWIPPEDEKVRLMLTSGRNVFTDYTEEKFLKYFGRHFRVLASQRLQTSGRTIYLMEKR